MKRTRVVPCDSGNAPPCSLTGFVRYSFDRGDSHTFTIGRGKGCGCVYVFMSELLSCSYVLMSESFLLARSDKMFAADSGTVHPMHCLTRGNVALYADGTQ